MPAKSKTTKAGRTRKPQKPHPAKASAATLKASETRIPPRTFNQVVYQGERVPVERRDGDTLYLVPREDVELLRRLEDKADVAILRKRRGEKAIPWEQVKRELGL